MPAGIDDLEAVFQGTGNALIRSSLPIHSGFPELKLNNAGDGVVLKLPACCAAT